MDLWYKLEIYNASNLILPQISVWLSFTTQLPIQALWTPSVVSWLYRKIESGIPFTRFTVLISSKSFNSPIWKIKIRNTPPNLVKQNL